MEIDCYINNPINQKNDFLLDFCNETLVSQIFNFHKSLPKYNPTPLVSLPAMAKYLEIKDLLIKDESKRFDLNAFKVLGASYAMAKMLGDYLNLKPENLTYDCIKEHQNKFKDLVFITATDGNHGRAVAWMAQKFGCKAYIYMPKGSSPVRLEAIQNYGAQASITDKNYDDTVVYAENLSKKNNWILLQDTAWNGYEEIPGYIMQGYFTLMEECLLSNNNLMPTHVFIQAGVGSLAAGLLAYLLNSSQNPTTYFVVVEPDEAPCIFESIKSKDGHPVTITGKLPTIMAGLACGKPSSIGYELLKSHANAFIKCSDKITKKGMRLMAHPLENDNVIVSGESGAVTFGVLHELITNKKFSKIKNNLKINAESRVLLFSTEGDTDPESYQKIISE